MGEQAEGIVALSVKQGKACSHIDSARLNCIIWDLKATTEIKSRTIFMYR